MPKFHQDALDDIPGGSSGASRPVLCYRKQNLDVADEELRGIRQAALVEDTYVFPAVQRFSSHSVFGVNKFKPEARRHIETPGPMHKNGIERPGTRGGVGYFRFFFNIWYS